MKKTYINPTLEVVKVQTQQQMLAGSVNTVTGLSDTTKEEYDPEGEPVDW